MPCANTIYAITLQPSQSLAYNGSPRTFEQQIYKCKSKILNRSCNASEVQLLATIFRV
jgi:hypothetical protein